MFTLNHKNRPVIIHSTFAILNKTAVVSHMSVSGGAVAVNINYSSTCRSEQRTYFWVRVTSNNAQQATLHHSTQSPQPFHL